MAKLNFLPSQKFHAHKIWKSLCEEVELPALDRFLTQFFRKNPQYGKRDRKLYADFFFSLFRKANWVVAKYFSETQEDLPNVLKNLTPDPKDLWFFLKKIPFPDLVELVLQDIPEKYLKKPFLSKVHPAYESYFLKRINFSSWNKEKVDLFFCDLDKRPPLWLRLNYREKKDQVFLALKKSGFKIEEVQLGDIIAFSVRGEKSIYELEEFKKGYIEIQDLASQWIGYMIDARPGMFLWDACAGGGGKTLLLASLLQNQGVIYASDIRKYKLEDTKKRLRKAQFFNVRFFVWDGTKVPEFSLEVQKRGGFHRVLVDVPCSGSGTWRRNPDTQFRFSLAKIQEMTHLQSQILESASKAVRPGGLLIYATCSWLYEENEAVVFSFLDKNTSFALKTLALYGFPEKDCDLMFACVMEKQK